MLHSTQTLEGPRDSISVSCLKRHCGLQASLVFIFWSIECNIDQQQFTYLWKQGYWGVCLRSEKRKKVLTFSWAAKISRSACQDVMSAIQSIVSLLVPGPGYIYTAANEFFIVNGEPLSPQPTHRKETFMDQKTKNFDKEVCMWSF